MDVARGLSLVIWQAHARLFRLPNLAMLMTAQFIIHYTLLHGVGLDLYLDFWHFFQGVIITISLAAGGYIINDLYDLENDQINKPDRISIGRYISKRRAWAYYGWFNLTAFLLGVSLANHVRMYDLWLLPLVFGGILYLYAVDLKKRPIIGNAIVSFLTALPILLVALYDLVPAVDLSNTAKFRPYIYILLIYSVFAFLLNFMREIVKDAEDAKGDRALGFKTLAILLSPAQFNRVLYILSTAFASLLLVLIAWSFKEGFWLPASALTLFTAAPFGYFVYHLRGMSNKESFAKLSRILKWIMLGGVLSFISIIGA